MRYRRLLCALCFSLALPAQANVNPDSIDEKAKDVCMLTANYFAGVATDRDNDVSIIGALVMVRNAINQQNLAAPFSSMMVDAVAFAYGNAKLTPDEVRRHVFLICIRRNMGQKWRDEHMGRDGGS